MYKANAGGPNTTYIPPACVRLMFGSGGLHVVFARVFRYPHVGNGNANSSRWGPDPMRSPNANGLTLQWNIGSNVDMVCNFIYTRPNMETFQSVQNL